jgi:hypothetical protein
MKGLKLFHQKKRYPDGSILEMKIWRVDTVKDKPHGIKFSLVYIKDGKRVVGYDNAEGRGYHRHYGERMEGYEFRNIDVLIEDFLRDVAERRIKNES